VSSVRDSDAAEVRVEDIEGKECLVISCDGYDQKFYVHDGKLMEEYTEPGGGIFPDSALEIGRTDTIEFEIDEEGILTVRTDSGSSEVNTGRRR